ncbi:MAG: hypothetical protein ACJARE_003345 [Paracoccaceae bacterium]
MKRVYFWSGARGVSVRGGGAGAPGHCRVHEPCAIGLNAPLFCALSGEITCFIRTDRGKFEDMCVAIPFVRAVSQLLCEIGPPMRLRLTRALSGPTMRPSEGDDDA